MVNLTLDVSYNKVVCRRRRLLRQAVNIRSTTAFRNLIAQDCDINMVMSHVHGDTLLMYSVKRNSLEMVEILLSFSDCAVDKPDRTGKTPLDEAISAWTLTAMDNSPDNRQAIGRRYRILKRLLSAGAHMSSATCLHQCISNVMNVKGGKGLVEKLSKTFVLNGNARAKAVLATVLISFKRMSAYIQALFLSGAEFACDLHVTNTLVESWSFVPIENIILLLCATHHNFIMEFINNKIISNERKLFKEWNIARHAFKLICLLGKQPSLMLIKRLFSRQPTMYKWYIEYQVRPPSLKHLARLRIRQILTPNVLAGSQELHILPIQLRNYLVFKRK